MEAERPRQESESQQSDTPKLDLELLDRLDDYPTLKSIVLETLSDERYVEYVDKLIKKYDSKRDIS